MQSSFDDHIFSVLKQNQSFSAVFQQRTASYFIDIATVDQTKFDPLL